MPDEDSIRKEMGNLIPMRAALDGASVEGLRGIKAVLEAEIKILQSELGEVDKRINEKINAGYPEENFGS